MGFHPKPNSIEISFCCNSILDQNIATVFSHAMTAHLSWHVKNYAAIFVRNCMQARGNWNCDGKIVNEMALRKRKLQITGGFIGKYDNLSTSVPSPPTLDRNVYHARTQAWKIPPFRRFWARKTPLFLPKSLILRSNITPIFKAKRNFISIISYKVSFLGKRDKL